MANVGIGEGGMGRPTRKSLVNGCLLMIFISLFTMVIPSVLKLPQIKKIGWVWQGCHFRIFLVGNNGIFVVISVDPSPGINWKTRPAARSPRLNAGGAGCVLSASKNGQVSCLCAMTLWWFNTVWELENHKKWVYDMMGYDGYMIGNSSTNSYKQTSFIHFP